MNPQPDIQGPHAQAWKFDLNAANEGRTTAGLDAWLIHAPWANSIWERYTLELIHLREVPGFPPPIIHLAGATHEIFVHALDPQWEFNLKKPCSSRQLRPTNYIGQFIVADDNAARAKVEAVIKEICDGLTSPDTDYGQHWIARFGASNVKGDPKKFGQTIIGIGHRQLTIDPAPVTKRPIDVLCKKCRHPLTVINMALLGLPNPPGWKQDICIRCQRGY